VRRESRLCLPERVFIVASLLLVDSVAFVVPHPLIAARAFLCEVGFRVWNGAQGGVVAAKMRRCWRRIVGLTFK
jgi:hypothetical protein